MSLARSLSLSMALLTVGRVLTLLMSLLMMVVLTRGLEPEGFGHFRSVIAYLGLAGIVSYLGLHLIFVREFSREGADQPRLLGEAVGLRLASAILVLAIAVGLAFLLPYPDIVRWGVLLAAPAFVAIAAHQLLTGVFQEKLRQGPPVAAEVVGGLLTLALILAALWAGMGIMAVVTAYLAGNIVMLAISWAAAYRLVPFRLRADASVWRSLLLPALPIAGTQLLQQAYYKTDIIVLALLEPAAEVGFYSVGRQILDTFVGFALMYAGLIMPLLSRHAGKDEGAFAQHLRDGFDTLAVGFIGAAALSFVFAPEIATLIGGPAFVAAGPALQALTPLIALYPLSLVCRFAVTARDRQAALLRGYAVAAVLGVGTFFILIPAFGAIGAAGGLLVGESVVFATVLIVLRRSAGVLPSWGTLAKAVSCAVVACLLIEVPWVAGLHWILRAALVGSAYLALLIATNAVPAQLRAMLPLPRRLAARSGTQR